MSPEFPEFDVLMSDTLRLVVGPSGECVRLDRYLADHWPKDASRAMVQRIIDGGAVEVDGRVARAKDKVRTGQTIVVRPLEPPAADETLRPEPIPLEIVYEDETLLVVNKPPGLVTHPAPGHWSGTLVNALLWHFQHAACGMRHVECSSTTPHPAPRTPHLARAGIVHRLDKDTSGLLMVAKTDAALRELSRQLKDRTLSRGYVALALGHLPFDEGTIDAPIGRHAVHRKEMSVRYLGGRPAVTRYRVLHRGVAQGSGLRVQGEESPQPRTQSPERQLRYSVLQVQLQTGRTHQIRVHLAQMGYPVLGDPVYGRHPESFWQEQGIGRQLLHAQYIRFMHPTTRQPIQLTAAIPDDMMRWIPPEVSKQMRA